MSALKLVDANFELILYLFKVGFGEGIRLAADCVDDCSVLLIVIVLESLTLLAIVLLRRVSPFVLIVEERLYIAGDFSRVSGLMGS